MFAMLSQPVHAFTCSLSLSLSMSLSPCRSISLSPSLTLVIVFLFYTYLISITTQHTYSKKVYWMRFCLLWWCDNLTHTHAYMDTDNIHCNNCSRPDWRLKIKNKLPILVKQIWNSFLSLHLRSNIFVCLCDGSVCVAFFFSCFI